MPTDEELRRQVQQQMQNYPNLNKVEAHQVGSAWAQQVINSEIENQRRREEERRRQQG